MITVTAKFLGGLRQETGVYQTTATFPDGAPVAQLIAWLSSLGIDPHSGDVIVTVDGRGLGQLSENFCLEKDCSVAVFPFISGG